MDLSADGSGLIPSDLDAERELVGPQIVDPHCSDRASSLPQTRFPLLTLDESAFEQRYLIPGVLAAGRECADSSSRITRSIKLDNLHSPGIRTGQTPPTYPGVCGIRRSGVKN
jgi:hypothetical protein